MRHPSSVGYCFSATTVQGAGLVKVFQKNTALRCGDFFENPQGLTFTAR
jgi:hypothetical protein